MVLALLSLALASPSSGVIAGAGIASGPLEGGGEFASVGPILGGTLDWRFGPVQAFIGASASGLVAPSGSAVVPIALLQGEAGFGFGSPMASGGFYFGAGLSGGEGGFYGRVTVPTDGSGALPWAQRLGGELRVFRLGASNASVVAMFLRAEVGEQRRRRGPPPPPPPPPEPAPVHHDDPYGA